MKVSVIIPALDEASAIGATLDDLARHHDADEVVVVDGGSHDATRTIAAERGARVVRSAPGRARQMNEGARHAHGDVLLFLHADTRLPRDAIRKVRRALAAPRRRAGRFRNSFDVDHPLLRFYAFFTRFHFLSFGDQAYFVDRGVFERLGGYREDDPLEDVGFYRRLRRHAAPLILEDAVVTSARRFTRVGVVRQAGIDLGLLLLYWLGAGGRMLESCKRRWYRDVR